VRTTGHSLDLQAPACAWAFKPAESTRRAWAGDLDIGCGSSSSPAAAAAVAAAKSLAAVVAAATGGSGAAAAYGETPSLPVMGTAAGG
jgi:hypothetical protein